LFERYKKKKTKYIYAFGENFVVRLIPVITSTLFKTVIRLRIARITQPTSTFNRGGDNVRCVSLLKVSLTRDINTIVRRWLARFMFLIVHDNSIYEFETPESIRTTRIHSVHRG